MRMPELPEVETITRELNKKIVGKKISDFIVKVPNYFYGRKTHLVGQRILRVTRRAKLLVFDLSNEYRAILHLKMSGQLFFLPKNVDKTKTGERENKYTRAIFIFSDSTKLLFNDIRRFGYVKVVSRAHFNKILDSYGPEPLSKEFDGRILYKIFKNRPKSRIKQLLLDQKAIAGIGNIYADEVLFLTRVSPLRRAGTITQKEATKMATVIKKVLNSSISQQGTSMDKYRLTDGSRGRYGERLKVYGREDEPCFGVCNGLVKRIKLGGRSSYYCPSCQR